MPVNYRLKCTYRPMLPDHSYGPVCGKNCRNPINNNWCYKHKENAYFALQYLQSQGLQLTAPPKHIPKLLPTKTLIPEEPKPLPTITIPVGTKKIVFSLDFLFN